MHHLDVRDLEASYAGNPVLRGVTLSADKGEVVSLIGPSGSGKSTLLRVLIGLTPPTAGAVSIGGTAVDYADKRSLRALRSRMSIVFQQFNLFQNMTARANVAIAPVKVHGVPKREAEERAMALLEKVGLGNKGDSYPDQLSGGQQQRVAIARALAVEPEILLLDEVTSALDPERVGEVLDTVRALAGDGITMLLVSHEMAFVREISTRVVMMDAGQVVETGTSAEIFTAAKMERTRAFVGAVIRHAA
ncbi:amino acid ABC transporter ATP-binding protein [Sphingomonas sp.]|uniref:amino acid ABC transporter ATP-binding protein n=1 Tax=Sphingomonas sp. TaxID=28214 RepID=UPI00261A97EC|nr:amino acid ABC transporter ATP-binding protein [Sphingomonas sp.]MDF2602792.1 peptide transporter ATP-binding protein [Sphingomonas sp.]